MGVKNDQLGGNVDTFMLTFSADALCFSAVCEMYHDLPKVQSI